MLPDIAAEVLSFLTRRDLDKASGVSKWLDAMIAECFEVFPLRPVAEVALNKGVGNFTLKLRTENDDSGTHSFVHSFCSMDEAVQFAASLLRNSYVELLHMGNGYRNTTLFPNTHFHHASSFPITPLMDALRSGAVRSLEFFRVDFSALNNDAFVMAVGCRGLQSIEVDRSVVPSGFITDELLRISAANGVLKLGLCANKSSEPHRLSEDAILDFFFRADAVSGQLSLRLLLDGSGVTDMFLTKFVERLLASRIRPSGSAMFYGAAKQLGLPTYAHYLAQGSMRGSTYRFPPMEGNIESYEVELRESSSFMSLRFRLVRESQ